MVLLNEVGSENYSGKKIPWTVMSVQVQILSGPQLNNTKINANSYTHTPPGAGPKPGWLVPEDE